MMKNDAQVGVIVAIMMVALLISMLIIIQVYYIPRWMKEREAEHMDMVANQFASLKYSIDLQAIEKSSSPLINSITLGSKELPYFVSSRAFGSLQILTSDKSNFSVYVKGDGMELVEYHYEGSNGEIDNVVSIDYFEVYITNAKVGDFYMVEIRNVTIWANVTNLFDDFLQINLTIKRANYSIFNQPIAVGIKNGSSYSINLLNDDYKFSTKILPYVEKPFNISLNSSLNGTFILDCEKYIKKSFSTYYAFGTVKYESQNAYFVDQDYIYEGGAVILSQRGGETVLFPPFFELSNFSGYFLNITLIDIVGMPGKTGAAGYGTYSIRTNYSSYIGYKYIAENVSINISTRYPLAWEKFIENEFNESGINYRILRGENYIMIESNQLEISFFIIKIYAQIGPGWIT